MPQASSTFLPGATAAGGSRSEPGVVQPAPAPGRAAHNPVISFLNLVGNGVGGTCTGETLHLGAAVVGLAVAPHSIDGTPDETAERICFLCSTRASFITGAYVVIDGGFVIQ